MSYNKLAGRWKNIVGGFLQFWDSIKRIGLPGDYSVGQQLADKHVNSIEGCNAAFCC